MNLTMRIGLPALLCASPVLALSGAGCGIPDEQYNLKVKELTDVKAELDEANRAAQAAKKNCNKNIADLSNENDTLKDRLKALGQNVSDLESEKSKLAGNLEATTKERDELRRAREAAEARNAQFRALFTRFKSMIDAGKLKVEIRNGLMLVKLADNILFDPGKTDLKPDGKAALKEVAGILAGIQGRKFQVAGHTDNVAPGRHGAYKSNWELSTARAVEVVHYMIDEGGMPADRLSAAGFADQLPVANNDTPEGRQQNRRIEIELLPNIEDLPPMDDITKEPATSAPAGAPATGGPATPTTK